MGFDLAAARQAGYSDEEIAGHLAKPAGFDLAAAKQAGYSDTDIIQSISGKWAPTNTELDVVGKTVGVQPLPSVAGPANQIQPFEPDPLRQALTEQLAEAAQKGGMDSDEYRQLSAAHAQLSQADADTADILTRIKDYAGAVGQGVVGQGAGSTLTGLGELYDVGVRTTERALGTVLPEGAMEALRAPIVPAALTPGQILKRPGEQLKAAGEAMAPPKDRQNLGTDIAAGVGQLGFQIASYLATGGASSTAMLFSQGADIMAEKTRQDVAPQAAKDAAILGGGAITAITERYGLDKILNRVPPTIKNAALRQIADVLAAGGIEAAQEVAEGLLHDISRRILTNPDAPLLEGIDREALAAGGAGAIARAVINAATGMRMRSRAGQAETQPQAGPTPQPEAAVSPPPPPATPPEAPAPTVEAAPVQPAQPAPAAAATGAPRRVWTAKGEAIDTRLEIVEADQLVTSHDETGGVNPSFPEDLQPRDRSRQDWRRRVADGAENLSPETLGDTGNAYDGAPVVGPDNVVESGNTRTLAMRKAYQSGKADEYKQWLKQNAGAFGLDPDQIDGMRNPVLVRRRAGQMTAEQRAVFAQEANVRPEQGETTAKAEPKPAEGIKNPMPPEAKTQEQKAAHLAKLSAENMQHMVPALEAVDQRVPGVESKANIKTPESIIAKANRPEIIKKKPWWNVEHVADSFRFRTNVDDVNSIGPAITETMKEIRKRYGKNVEVLRFDTEKMKTPGPWGWRMVALDLRMPNGQIAEYYFPTKEMHQALEGTLPGQRIGNHELFEKWRNRDVQSLSKEERAQFERDAEESKRWYDRSMRLYYSHTGQTEADFLASLRNLDAMAESLASTKSLDISSVVKPLSDTGSPSLNKDQSPLSMTKTRTSDLSRGTKTIEPSGNDIDNAIIDENAGQDNILGYGTLSANPFGIALQRTVGIYRKAAQSLVDRFHDKIGYRYEALRDLPDKQKFLTRYYELLGKVSEIEGVQSKLYDAFKNASDTDKIAVYQYLTTANAKPSAIQDAEVRRSAVAAKRLIDRIGERLVHENLLSRQTVDEHRGEYLPRIYLKHLLGESSMKALGRGMVPSDMGYLKERQDIPEDVRRLILGEIKDPGYLSSRGFGIPARDVAILDFFRDIAGNKKWIYPNVVTEWGGKPVSVFWLKAEAERLQKQAPYMPAADRPEVDAIVRKMRGIYEPVIDELGKTPDNYKQIPDTAKYGAMRGLWVRAEIYELLLGSRNLVADNDVMQKIINGATWYNQIWKSAKVAWNPPAQVRNHISNGILVHMSGVPFAMVPVRYVQAIQAIRSNNKYWRIAKRYGVKAASFNSQELLRIERDLLDLMSREQGKFSIATIKNMGGIVNNAVGDAYQFSESLWKTAKIIDAMKREGLSPAEAAKSAHDAVFDYSMVPQFVKKLRTMPIGAPFATFNYKVLPLLLKTAIVHPERYVPYIAIPYVLAELIKDTFDIDDDDLKALQKALPRWLEEKGTAYFLPIKDARGRWQAMDFGYFMPWGGFQTLLNAVTSKATEGALGRTANVLQAVGAFGGPVTNLITAIQSGTDPFTGKEIANKNDPPAKQAADLMQYLWRLNAPTWITDIGVAGHMYRAVTGKVNPRLGPQFGEQMSTTGQAALRGVGVNIYPIDPEKTRDENLRNMAFDIKNVVKRMRTQLRDPNLTDEQKANMEAEYKALIEERRQAFEKYEKSSRVHPNLRTTIINVEKPDNGI